MTIKELVNSCRGSDSDQGQGQDIKQQKEDQFIDTGRDRRQKDKKKYVRDINIPHV